MAAPTTCGKDGTVFDAVVSHGRCPTCTLRADAKQTISALQSQVAGLSHSGSTPQPPASTQIPVVSGPVQSTTGLRTRAPKIGAKQAGGL